MNPTAHYSQIDTIAISQDEKHMGYEAQIYDPAIYNNYEAVVIDGMKKQRYDGVSSLTFSPDGNTYAYGARTNIYEPYHLIVNDRDLGNFGSPYEVDVLTFSQDSKHIAYGTHNILVDGVPIDSSLDIYTPKSAMEVEGERTYVPLSRVGLASFSPNDAYIAYANRDWQSLNIGKREIHRFYAGQGTISASAPFIWSQDSKSITYAISNGDKFSIITDHFK